MPMDRVQPKWWHPIFNQYLLESKAHPDARIVWLGDSITQYWQRQSRLEYANNLPVWKKYYAPYDALSFGIGGDTTSNLIWRLDNGQVAGLHPRLTIILIGINNFYHFHWSAGITTAGIETVVSITLHCLPDSHILLLGILPSTLSNWISQQTAIVNQALAMYYAHNPAVTFIDVSPAFMIAGKPNPALYLETQLVPPRPALHPDAAGMATLAAYIQPEVQRYLKVRNSR
jgi:lysophospholipase L1-like esterase